MNEFKEKSYIVIKEAISKELANFVYNYFLIKKQCCDTMNNYKWLSPNTEEWGVYNDGQVPNTYSCYGDTAMETLLLRVKPVMEDLTKLKLTETYSYARIYKKGDILKKHKDRPSCEISTTMNLGGDEWPIFIEPNKNVGVIDEKGYTPGDTKGQKVILKPGDMLVYRGCDLEHWREKFEGDHCVQVFLHYNDLDSEFKADNIYDYRPHIGLPTWFKHKKYD